LTVIAYCITAHKNPKQVNRLLSAIYAPSDFFYLNIFGVTSQKDKMEWMNTLETSKRKNTLVKFRYSNAYATFKLIRAVLDAMMKFTNLQYDYFINLSGQCYPIKSNKCIKNFLSDQGVSYMHSAKVETEWPDAAVRYRRSFYRVPLNSAINSIIRHAKLERTNFGRKYYDRNYFIGVPRIVKRLPYELEFYGGSTWNCLAKRHVDYVLRYLNDKLGFLEFFEHVGNPDEHFFQTILMNSTLRDEVIDNCLMYVNWNVRPGEPAPATLTMADSQTLIKSSKLYARKFDITVDEHILDFIDRHKEPCNIS
jgi:hypothetical protein